MHDLTRISKNLSAAVGCLEQISVNTKALLDKQISIDESIRIIASGREPEKWYGQGLVRTVFGDAAFLLRYNCALAAVSLRLVVADQSHASRTVVAAVSQQFKTWPEHGPDDYPSSKRKEKMR